MLMGIRFVVIALFVASTLAVSCTTSPQRLSERQKKLVIATDASFPPMETVDSQGNLVGFDLDLSREISRRTGIAVSFVNVSWDGIFTSLLEKKYDAIISSVSITEERQKRLGFSVPYFNGGKILAVSRKLSSLTSQSDIAGRKVGVVGTESGINVITSLQKVEVVAFQDYDPLFAALENGQVDAILTDFVVVVQYNQKSELLNHFRFLGKQISTDNFGIVLRKEDTSLKTEIDKSINNIQQDGTLTTLERKWGLGVE
jgi:polar amino acid transport system substrate-binding protein